MVWPLGRIGRSVTHLGFPDTSIIRTCPWSLNGQQRFIWQRIDTCLTLFLTSSITIHSCLHHRTSMSEPKQLISMSNCSYSLWDPIVPAPITSCWSRSPILFGQYPPLLSGCVLTPLASCPHIRLVWQLLLLDDLPLIWYEGKTTAATTNKIN